MYEVGELLLREMGFSGYESAILHNLLKFGKLQASEISEKSGVPLPKVYQHLKKKLMPDYPHSILSKKEGKLKVFYVNPEKLMKDLKEEFPDKTELVDNIMAFYAQERAKKIVLPKFIELKPTGEESQRTTLELYKSAEREIDIISRSMGYLPSVLDGLWTAAKQGVRIRMLFPSKKLIKDENASRQIENTTRLIKGFLGQDSGKSPFSIKYLTEEIRRFGANGVWLHGSIVDPPSEEDVKEYSGKYKGAAVFTIELPEREAGLYKREVVLSRDPRFIMSLKLFFELLWEYCASATNGQ